MSPRYKKLIGTFVMLIWLPVYSLIAMGIGLIGFTAGLALLAAVDFEPDRFIGLLTGDASLTGRLELWRFAVHAASERPWLGHGYGAFWDVGAARDPLSRLEPGSWLGDIETGTINQAHNGYLELWLEMGLPAAIWTVGVALMTIAAGLRAGAAAVSGGQRAAITCAVAISAVSLAHNLTEATLLIRGQILCSFFLLSVFVLRNIHSAKRQSM